MKARDLTLSLQIFIAGNGTRDRIYFPLQPVHRALGEALRLGRTIFGFSARVALFARLLPRGGVCQVAGGFYDCPGK